jgi:hypothetical protein
MHVCTITSARYWAHARVLAESFLACHAGSRVSILAVDGTRGQVDDLEGVEVLEPDDIGIDAAEFDRRATMYSAQGLAVSMKADLLSTLLARGQGPVVLVDADGMVYDTLQGVHELCEAHGLVFSPHLLGPNPTWWGEDSPEQLFLRAGIFNAGLVGVGSGGERFLEWWADRNSRRCVFDERHALLIDQHWLTIAAAFFDPWVLRDRGCNVAGWNLHDRDIVWDGDRPTIDGEALRHFHFACSYDPEHPESLTPQQHAHWWPQLADRPGAARASRQYAARLMAAGYSDVHARPVRYDTMPDGAPIEDWMREVYRAALIAAEFDGTEEPPNPFTDGQQRFSAWVNERGSERLQAAAAAEPGVGSGAADNSLSAREMVEAMANTGELLGRIGELERARDEAIAWATRVSVDLQEAKDVLDVRDATIADRDRVMQQVWNSPSWRVTKPLRSAKTILRRTGDEDSPPSAAGEGGSARPGLDGNSADRGA